jgi:hypothetical protein
MLRLKLLAQTTAVRNSGTGEDCIITAARRPACGDSSGRSGTSL